MEDLRQAGLCRTKEDVRAREALNPKQAERRKRFAPAAREGRGAKRPRTHRENVRAEDAASRGGPDVEALRNLPVDTSRPCINFFSARGCNRGSKCRFAHVE